MSGFLEESLSALVTVVIFGILLGIVIGIVVPGYNDIMIGILETVAMY